MEQSETTLSQAEIVRAATNAPELSENVVTLGDRNFTIVDLPYEDYLVFLSKLQPLLEALAGRFAPNTFSPSTLNVSTILTYCGKELPEMAQIICKQTDPEITVEEVKRLGKSPFKLAGVVLKQIAQNRTISDISDFFVQMIPLMKVGEKLIPLKTEETPS